MYKWLFYLILLSALEPMSRWPGKNNVCKHFIDYFYPGDNKNCFYDPDVDLRPPDIIAKYAGNVEVHNATTQDGYILTLFRIPNSQPKGVILLHHSIATYSHIYLWQGNNSLAINLWRHGFDVWLANQRGTFESNKHVNLTTNDYKYWNFSFHEMALYDVSSELELIRSKTNGSKVIYFGHSLGSMVGLIYSAMKPTEAANYLKSMVLLATPAYFEHPTSLIYWFKSFVPFLTQLLGLMQIGSALFFLPAFLPISRIVFRLFPFLLYFVCLAVWAFCGYTPRETDPTFFNYDGLIYENNFSWKTLLHFGQLSKVQTRLQMYDYGEEKNLLEYGSKVPPLYPIGNVTVPTLLVSSHNDTLISIKDCDRLFEELRPEAKIHGHWKLSGLNHLDYHLGLHRKEIFVDKLLDFLNELY